MQPLCDSVAVPVAFHPYRGGKAVSDEPLAEATTLAGCEYTVSAVARPTPTIYHDYAPSSVNNRGVSVTSRNYRWAAFIRCHARRRIVLNWEDYTGKRGLVGFLRTEERWKDSDEFRS